MKNTNAKLKQRVFVRDKVISSCWEDDEYRVYWEGLVFVSGILSGTESVMTFIAEVRTKGIQDAVRILRGIFFISIENKITGENYAFVDNSGLYQAFYTENAVSTSFLKLVEINQLKVDQIDPKAVIEFVSFGVMFFDKTYFESISRIPREAVICIDPLKEKICILKKNKSPLHEYNGKPVDDFFDEFIGFATSLSNLHLSVDFTGGTDTRLIALLLDSCGLKFETAVSGGSETYADVSMSKDVAARIGHPWYSSIHSFESLEEDIPQLISDTEGLNNILHYHRLYQLQQSRLKRGVDTIISGVGGDLFKDTWWLQDFPFYSRKTSNIERLLDMRIMSSVPEDSFFTQLYSGHRRVLKTKMLAELMKYRLDSNTKTYDNIFFNLRMREEAGRELTNYSPYVKTFAPLLDLDIVRIGYNLQRRKRIMNYFHRREITKLNPSIAKMSTTEGGISASSDISMMILDVPKYTIDKIKRLCIKMGFRKQNKFAELNRPGFFSHVREMKTMKESLTVLKDFGIINHKTSLDGISNDNLGMILTLGQLIQSIGA